VEEKPTPKAAREDISAESVAVASPLSVPKSNPVLTVNEKENTDHHDDSSQGYVAGRSMRCGDYDQAIRSMRDGQRRRRPNRPSAGKIFLDGGRPKSRVFDRVDEGTQRHGPI
jgi:diaphanous 1